MSTPPPNYEIVLGHRIPEPPNSTHTSGLSRIIFREIDLLLKQNGHIDVVYLNDSDNSFEKNIDEFIDTLLPYSATAEHLAEPTSPLDLNCYEDCFIVFMLSSKRNWQFSTSGDCFSTKKNKSGKYYGLVHVMPNGDRVVSDKPLPDGCRLLFFKAVCDSTTYNDGFNLRIDLKLPDFFNTHTGLWEKRRTKIIIDPDIRNPGGSGS